MSYALVVRPAAGRDVAEAHAYWSQHGRGDAFMASVDHVFTQIAERPLMYAVVNESLQCSVRFQRVTKVVGAERGHVVVAEAMAQQQLAMCGRVLSRRMSPRMPSRPASISIAFMTSHLVAPVLDAPCIAIVSQNPRRRCR